MRASDDTFETLLNADTLQLIMPSAKTKQKKETNKCLSAAELLPVCHSECLQLCQELHCYWREKKKHAAAASVRVIPVIAMLLWQQARARARKRERLCTFLKIFQKALHSSK